MDMRKSLSRRMSSKRSSVSACIWLRRVRMALSFLLGLSSRRSIMRSKIDGLERRVVDRFGVLSDLS